MHEFVTVSVKSPSTASMASRSARLLEERAAWLGFLQRRLGSREDAEDVLQSSLAKALSKVAMVRADANVVAWFYRVLRRAVIDHQRTRAADQRRRQSLANDLKATEDDFVPSPADGPALCACLLPRIKSLSAAYAEVLWAIDIEHRPIALLAKERGTTTGALHVTLHRARKALRVELQRFCGACADGKCLDCDCPPTEV